jgi:filamentous hemagglutinin family protein
MQNKLNTKWRWLRLIFLLLSILFPLRITIAAGGIATDGTVGPAQSLSGPEVDIDQRLGTTVGKNLFHSFSEFNVNNGQTVTFRENTPNALDNVISRVTGGSRSDINGTLSSTPKGHANLYLINPSGVMFGKNARIDVPGAFHASTADEVRFQDGARFSASQPAGSTLTAAAPASFGFLGTSVSTNGLLKVDGAQLAVGQGKKLGMVGRNISVENGAKLSAPEGEVRLEAVGQGSMNVPVNQPSETAHGVLTLTGSSTIDGSGEGGGKVIVRGRDLSMDQNAKILAKTNGKKNGAGIDVRLTGNMTMKGGSLVQAGTTGNGASGKILVTAKNLQIDGQNTVTGISSEAGNSAAKEKHSTGRAGDIELRIENQLSLARSGQINSSSYSTGDAGNITVNTRQLWIDTQGVPKDSSVNPLSTGIITQAAKAWSDQSGDIAVNARGNITIKGGSRIDADSFGKHNAGDIRVTAKNLLIDGQTTLNGQKSYLPTFIDSNVGSGQIRDEETGNGGSIILDIKDKLSLIGGGVIRSSTYGTGDAGKIKVNVGQLLIDGQGAILLKDNFGSPLKTGIITEAMKDWSGKGGNIDVAVRGDMAIKGGGTISADTSGLQRAGDIYVKANNLQLDGQTTLLSKQTSYFLTDISSNTHLGEKLGDKAGKAGNITVDIADRLKLIQGGRIISTVFGSGDAGSVTVKAGQLLIDTQGTVDNEGNSLQTAIYTEAVEAWSGKGGNIDVTVRGDMAVKGGGTISARTFGLQRAGDIHVKANNLLLDGHGQETLNEQTSYFPTFITSSTNLGEKLDDKAGKAGNITVDIAGLLSLTRDGQINSTTFSSGDAGNVVVKAGQLLIDEQGASMLKDKLGNPLSTGIFTDAPTAWSGKGGNVDVIVRGDMTIKGGGAISASSYGEGDAGNITVNADKLSLEQDSYVSTESNKGNGGDITIQGGQLIQLIDSGFTTSVYGGEQREKGGGNINITADNLVMETGLIQANTRSPGASGGDITLNLKGLITSGGRESLILGGDEEVPWQPGVFGLNVIQAAAPNGISGHIQSTAPQLDLSGVLANLGMPQFDVYTISQDYCSLGTGSSLVRQGKGGLPLRSRDSVMY